MPVSDSPPTLGQGLYSLAELGRYLSLPLSASAPTLLRWIRHGLAPSGHQAGRPSYSFHDLVSLMVVGALRRRLPLATIREAEMWLRADMGLPRPFATEDIYTDGVNVLVRANPAIAHQLTAANRRGQEVMERALAGVLEGVSYKARLASSWVPREGVLIDPALAFGAPCVAGTRVSTAQLAAMREAGDSEQDLAKMFALEPSQVAAALAFERQLARAA